MCTHTLCDDLREALELNIGIAIDPLDPTFDLNRLCTEVVTFMRCKGFERGLGKPTTASDGVLTH